MATKKQISELESLLEWEREDRLPEVKKLFNEKVSETLHIREIDESIWLIETVVHQETGEIQRSGCLISHKTLINLGLSIMRAIKYTRDR